jgi:hypothetical protein
LWEKIPITRYPNPKQFPRVKSEASNETPLWDW